MIVVEESPNESRCRRKRAPFQTVAALHETSVELMAELISTHCSGLSPARVGFDRRYKLPLLPLQGRNRI